MQLGDHFEIISVRDQVFHFRLTGMLSDEVVAAIGPQLEAAYQKAIDSFGGAPFINYVDLRDLRPLPRDAKALVARLMEYGGKRNLFYSININPSALSNMTVRSAGQASHTDDVRAIVATEEDAALLLKKKREELARLAASVLR